MSPICLQYVSIMTKLLHAVLASNVGMQLKPNNFRNRLKNIEPCFGVKHPNIPGKALQNTPFLIPVQIKNHKV